MFKAGQALTKAYKKFDDFVEKGLLTTVKDKFKNRPTTATPKINRPGKIVSAPPAKITGKALTIFDPKKALPSIKGATKTAKKVGRIGRIARAATPIGLGFEAANIAYKVATRTPEMKARSKALKTKLSKTKTKDYHSDLLKMSVGGDTMLKKIPEGPKGEGLRKLKAKRPDVTRKMGFAKKGKMLKARYGTMAKGDVKEGLKKSKDFKNKLEDFRRDAISKLRGKQVGPAEEAKFNKMMPSIKDSPSVMKSKMEAVKSKISKVKKGKMMYANVGVAAKKVRENQMMKASMGKSVRGYGAARTSGMGLQDEQLPPGKSLDYYKDLM